MSGHLYKSKKKNSVYRLYCTKKKRLELNTKIGLEKYALYPEILAKCLEILRFGLTTSILAHLGKYLVTQCILLSWNRELNPLVLSTKKYMNRTKMICLINGSRRICMPKLRRQDQKISFFSFHLNYIHEKAPKTLLLIEIFEKR